MNFFDEFTARNILKRIEIKKHYIQLLLPNRDYVAFIGELEKLEKFTYGIEHSCSCDQIELRSFRCRQDLISQSEKAVLKLLNAKRDSIDKTPEIILRNEFLNDVKDCAQDAIDNYDQFCQDIALNCKRVYVIKFITNIYDGLYELKFHLNVAITNFQNLVKQCFHENTKNILMQIYKSCLLNTEKQTRLVCDHFSLEKSAKGLPEISKFDQHITQNQKMDDRIRSEMDKLRQETNFTASEIQSLKKEMFSSDTSLKTQERKTKIEIDQRASTAHSHIESIDKLQVQLSSVEEQLGYLAIEKQTTETELSTNKEALKTAILDMIRLEALLAEINSKIQKENISFDAEMETLINQKQEILENSQLNEREMEILLQDLITKITEVQANHQNEINMLETERIDTIQKTEERTKSLISLKQDIRDKYLEEIGKLQELKLNGSASDAERLEQEIYDLNDRLQDDLQSSEQLETELEELITVHEQEELQSNSKSSMSQHNVSEVDVEATVDLATLDNAAYIRLTVGKPLVQALALVCIQQPEDPLQFLADYFLHYHYNEIRNHSLEKELDELMCTEK